MRLTYSAKTMKFEHLIEINDDLNPLLEPLSVEQLWRGLVLRAESPQLFMPHLDECHIDARSVEGLSRRLRYGELEVADRVEFEPMREVRYLVPAQGEISMSSLTMSIESPTEGALFVRFQYDDGHDAATDAANSMYDDYRRSAYHAADLDTIQVLRELAQQGRLDSLLN